MKGRSIAEIATGAVVLAAAAIFLVYAVMHGGRTPQISGIALTAQFDRIDGLNEGADVRIGGVKVGSVTDLRIDPRTFQAVVALRVRADIELPSDSSAEVTSEGLLGGKYISIVPGGGDRMLRDGGRITETQGSVSLESLLGRFIFSVTQMNSANGGANGERPAPAPATAPATR
ncbi:outer membrane lipid asymmetry maintenance protein MlaD [Roseococcus sp. SYP-B2431]|uniref:outer membrane lipid asymmetry maintenance protein MlaD n=1 Tax=Roseococcus sp. SYP-B2431 TaxID=2496640 RepID=UPI00103DBF7C|nr:outer membrane lipid asymmetry maintenance protein MlaD [Roseococcus sp. SYP-B2431]TCH97900.1 outer membrane lipid asymmetry maintenance protein MlaD [Roseococcus sp. SYP-B2431]